MMRRLPFLVALVGLTSTAVFAQSIAEEQRALLDAKRSAAIASNRSAQLEAAAARASDQATQARAQAAAVAARVQAAESDIAAASARMRIIGQLRARQQASLAARQMPLVRLTAALATMARRPPAMALVQPGSIADLVHVRALLGATIPVIQSRTASLRAEVAKANRLRQRAEQALASLRAGQQELRQQRARLAQLETSQRQRSVALTSSAMLESDKALALGEQARDIVDLMQEMGAQADVRAHLAVLPGPLLRPSVPGAAPAPSPPPPEAAIDAPRYRLPVVGMVVTGLGEVSPSGVRARGLTFATAAAARVVAPSDGRVAYAGPFRGYGKIVIIDHGGGWTSLVTGMAQVAVTVGDTVTVGNAIGQAGAGRPRITLELRRGGQPVDVAGLVGSR